MAENIVLTSCSIDCKDISDPWAVRFQAQTISSLHAAWCYMSQWNQVDFKLKHPVNKISIDLIFLSHFICNYFVRNTDFSRRFCLLSLGRIHGYYSKIEMNLVISKKR